MQSFTEKTYHRNKVIICIRILLKCQDKLWKVGVELHDSFKVLLIILRNIINSVTVVSAYN